MRTLIVAALSVIAMPASAAAGTSVEASVKAAYSRVESVEMDGPSAFVGLRPINNARQDLLAQSLCYAASESAEKPRMLYIIDENRKAAGERRVIGEWNCENL